MDFYNSNKSFFQGTKPGSYKGYIGYTTGLDGVAYLKVTSQGHDDLEGINKHIFARKRIAIIIQAFPSKHTEIIKEEVIERLINVAETSILPLLSSLTEADIKDWLLPKTPSK